MAEKITLDSVIKPEWVEEIYNYTTESDSNAVTEYAKILKSCVGSTLQQLAKEIFKRIYPGEFPRDPDVDIEAMYFETFVKNFNNNTVGHLNEIFN
jgi:malonyl CoA-acyl carrier protein transacylase